MIGTGRKEEGKKGSSRGILLSPDAGFPSTVLERQFQKESKWETLL